MFTLIIEKSKSIHFNKAVKCALSMGGTFDGKCIILEINEDLHIYKYIFPILKYNVTNWVGTRGFFNKKEVNPYRFMLQKHLSVRTAVNYVAIQLDKKPLINKYTYYKRVGCRFYFINDDFDFDIELNGKELCDFIEFYDIGDSFNFKL